MRFEKFMRSPVPPFGRTGELRTGAFFLEQVVHAGRSRARREMSLSGSSKSPNVRARAGHTRTHMGTSPSSVRSLQSVHFSMTPLFRTGTRASP